MDLFPAPRETIEGAGQALRDGRSSCAEILEECLARIDEWEPRVRAWVVVDRAGAIAQARERDDELKIGRHRGHLHGIPVGIKDIIDVAGMPTAAGARHWANAPAVEDAQLVADLRRAGAVIVGKTVTTPYAWIDPPVTRNPWNLDRTPGGSSSGSVAAVACGMCLGAVGTQTGGSITRPASFCGVAGCKPTYGSVSTRGIVPFSAGLDHPGPIARSVADLSLLLDGMRGLGTSRPCEQSGASAPRLGRLRGFFDQRSDKDMRRALGRACGWWNAASARVVDTPLPDDFEEAVAVHRVIMSAEAAAFHELRFADQPEDYPPRISQLLVEGLGRPATAYIRSQERRSALKDLVAGCFQEADVLVCPASSGPAPAPDTTGDPSFNAPWSLLGLPTVTFPIGLAADGLPLGVQLVGKWDRDRDLVSAALWCEDVVRHALRTGRD